MRVPILQRLRSTYTNAVRGLTQLVFSRGTKWVRRYLGGTSRIDFFGQTRPDVNSAVVACVNWLARNFPEAPPLVTNITGKESQPVLAHPMTQLLRRPNPYYSGILLWQATIVSWVITGNAYWLKRRSGIGRPVELWWIPSNLMEPEYPEDGSEFLTGYTYTPDGRAVPIHYDVSEVVHFRYGLDPENPRKGLSPVLSILREIFTDDEAANYAAVILRNLGVPYVVISPDDTSIDIDEEAAGRIADQFVNKFAGDGRGRPLVLNGKSKVEVLSHSPKDMDLTAIRRIPEERISAVIGVPAIVAGLGAGLDASTYSNYAQAREAAYESGIIPAQRLFAEEIRVQLLADFADIDKFDFGFDLSKVRVLQDDENLRYKRLTSTLMAGGMKLNTFLRETGQEELPTDQGDVFYIPRGVTPTKPDALIPEPIVAEPVTSPFAPSPNGTNGQPTPNGKVAVAA